MQSIFIETLQDTLSFAPRILIIMFFSLFVSGLLIELGLIRRLEFITRPLLRLTNLPKEVSLSFLTSFGSLVAGYTILAQNYRKGLINKEETFLSALLCSIPLYIREIFTYQIPIMISILGIKIGMIYFLSFLLSGFARLVFVISFGRIRLKKTNLDKKDLIDLSFKYSTKPIRRKFIYIFFSIFKQETKIFLKIALFFVLMTFVIFFLINIGILNSVKDIVQPLTSFFRLPPESILPVTTYMFNPLIGATSVSTLVEEGKLTELQAMITCMLGGFLMLPIYSLRYSLPKYIPIFGFSLGINIILVSTLLGMLVRGIFLLAFLFMI